MGASELTSHTDAVLKAESFQEDDVMKLVF